MNCTNCHAVMTPYMDRGYFHCNHCGAFQFPEENKDGVQSFGEATKVDCPVCHHAMVTAIAGGEVVLHCENCRGVLSMRSNFAIIVQRMRSQGGADISKPLDEEQLERDITCPTCHRTMHTHPYAGPSNVVIDVCIQCELIFLDPGELSDIRDAPGRR